MSIVIALPGNEAFATRLAAACGAEVAGLICRAFPDGESYVRLPPNLKDRSVILVCTLARPDDQILRLLFAAMGARDCGAKAVRLVAPYLAYMRQDRAFHLGEVVSARHFAGLLSSAFDEIITVEPHLHRIRTLEEIFTAPTRAVSAAGVIAEWIQSHVSRPFLVGPDAESRPWISAIADLIGAPAVVMEKTRTGDRAVVISAPDLAVLRGRRPVVVDDIVSSAATMIEACRQLAAAHFDPPVCVAVHALFEQAAAKRLLAVCGRLACTDTAPNPYAEITIVGPLAKAISG